MLSRKQNKMYIDFAITDTEINEAEAKILVNEIQQCPVQSITLPYYLIKTVKNLVPQDKIVISCFIDYPLGISDIKTRRCAIEQAFKAGANAVDIAMPQNLAANRKYDKIRDDIKSVIEFCTETGLHPRYILEYRIFDHHCLKKICEIFESFGIKYVYPSTGYFLDNLADNILASIFLHENSKDLNIICTGNIWTNKHFETMLKSGLFGFRTTSIHSLRNFIKFNSTHKD
jgi:deoxyribose-phosphate aldolase